MAEQRFDPLAVLRALVVTGVRFVLVGGYAAVIHGSTLMTYDADICPDPDPENLGRLCAVLHDIGARIRVADEPDGIPFSCDEHFLTRMAMLNLTTNFGDFDLVFRPAGTDGYADLVDHATEYDLGGVVVSVASLDDIIHSKETADRAKDRAALPQLYALRDETERRSEPS